MQILTPHLKTEHQFKISRIEYLNLGKVGNGIFEDTFFKQCHWHTLFVNVKIDLWIFIFYK